MKNWTDALKIVRSYTFSPLCPLTQGVLFLTPLAQ